MTTPLSKPSARPPVRKPAGKKKARAKATKKHSVEDEFDYIMPPPIREYMIKVKYVYAGKGKPIEFDVGDETE